ncbi:MAG: serine/threonine protein kinase [Bdellovibrionales bacterium]|nr:serine/threonine protein kinase [Bdellovibrionales bacterium]
MPASLIVDPAELAAQLGGRFVIANDGRAGGQGLVVRATRRTAQDGTPAQDDVALKLYFDAVQVERVEREVAVLHRLRHPSLSRVVEHGSVSLGGRTLRYVAFEFIDGDPLDHRLTNSGALAPRTVAIVGRDVASALSHIWRERIVHRDVNPKNIMLRIGDREAVLIDLGIARHLNESTLTSLGKTWGTMGYMSPEHQRAEQALTSLSDVFSLGVTLLEALTGTHPTGGDQSLIATRCPLTAAVAPSAPAGLAQLIDRMLSHRAAFRPDPEALSEEFSTLVDSL